MILPQWTIFLCSRLVTRSDLMCFITLVICNNPRSCLIYAESKLRLDTPLNYQEADDKCAVGAQDTLLA